MKDGRFDDAARDYGASYELSKDPALFFKIGRANERAGKCEIALIYYARYLREGKPTEQFVTLTSERIAACRAKVPASGDGASGSRPGPGGTGTPGSGTDTASAGDAAGSASGGASAGASRGASAGASGGASTGASSGASTGTSSGASTGAGEPAIRTGGGTREPPPTSNSTATRAPGGDTAAAAGNAPASAAAAPAGTPPPPLPIPNNRQKVAWLMGGSAIALVTLGGVLAYAARSSENDVRDLYAGFAGQAPPYDTQTQKRYAELVDDGKRYQHLSWAAFGLAGAATVGAALLFTLGGDEPAQGPRVAPVVTTRSAGISVRF
jgi:hypothetical protein